MSLIIYVVENFDKANWISRSVSIKMYSNGGAVVRALRSHQCGPGSFPRSDAICGLSLLLVLSLAPRGFSPGTPVFPSPQKPTFPNSNSTRNQVDEEPLYGCATSKSLFILFIFLYFEVYTMSEYNEQWVALLSMHPLNIYIELTLVLGIYHFFGRSMI